MVLVDLSPPFDTDVCHNLHQALQHFMALSCSLAGPCRMPFFGLFALGNYPEVSMSELDKTVLVYCVDLDDEMIEFTDLDLSQISHECAERMRDLAEIQ